MTDDNQSPEDEIDRILGELDSYELKRPVGKGSENNDPTFIWSIKS